MPINPTSSKARLVVVHTVYHQIFNQQPRQALDARYSRILRSDEQSYGPRTITVGEQWTPLEIGWLGNFPLGLIVITNGEGNFMERNPTPIEYSEAEKRILEIRFDETITPGGTTPHLLILPRESQSFIPANPATVKIRCRSGEGKYTILVVPA